MSFLSPIKVDRSQNQYDLKLQGFPRLFIHEGGGICPPLPIWGGQSVNGGGGGLMRGDIDLMAGT